MIMIIIILQRKNHYEMQNALYLKISFEVCPILEWSKKNPAEDNLLKKNYCPAFRLKKENIWLVGQLGKKALATEKSSTPHPLKSQMACPLWFWVVSVWT